MKAIVLSATILMSSVAFAHGMMGAGDGSFEKVFSEVDRSMSGNPAVICSCDTSAMASGSKDVIGTTRAKVIQRCLDFLSEEKKHELNKCELL